MSGGAKEHIIDIVRKYTKPVSLYVGLALVMGITYVRQIPARIRAHADRGIARLLVFLTTMFIADMYSWTYGLMAALFSILIVSVSPRIEGFEDDTDIKMVTQKRRWYIEEVMGENPIGISEDKVATKAIQDQGNSVSTGK
jgi:hypothetical protein